MKVLIPIDAPHPSPRLEQEAFVLQGEGVETEILAPRSGELPEIEFARGVRITRLDPEKADPRRMSGFQLKAFGIKLLSKLRRSLLKKLFDLEQDYFPRRLVSDDILTELFTLDKQEVVYLFAILKERPDLLHLQGPLFLKTGVLAGQILKIPLLYEIAEFSGADPRQEARAKRKFEELEKEFLPLADLVLAPSRETAEKIAEDYQIRLPEVAPQSPAQAALPLSPPEEQQPPVPLPEENPALSPGALFPGPGLEAIAGMQDQEARLSIPLPLETENRPEDGGEERGKFLAELYRRLREKPKKLFAL